MTRAQIEREAQMNEYIRQNYVTAVPMTYGEYKAKNPDATDYKNQPTDARGYEVTYCTGYRAWCPKAHFERTSRPVDGMTFGMAVEAMKRGKRVARRVWTNDGKWVFLRNGSSIAMYFASGNALPWVATTADVLAEDWSIVCDESSPTSAA